jgi:preprotein translocase subunit YajC
LKKIKAILLGLVALLVSSLVFLSSCIPTTAPAEGTTPTFWDTYGIFVFLIVIFVFFWFTMIRPQRKKQKEHEKLMSELKNGDRVITAGGMYGVIDSVSEDSIVIRVESGALIRVARGGVLVKRD